MKANILFLAILLFTFLILGCNKSGVSPESTPEIETPAESETEEDIEENETGEEEKIVIELRNEIIGTYKGMLTYHDYYTDDEIGFVDIKDTIFNATYTIEDVIYIPPEGPVGVVCYEEKGVIRVFGWLDFFDGKKDDTSNFCYEMPLYNLMQSRDDAGYAPRTQWGLEIDRVEKTVRYYVHLYGLSNADTFWDGFYTKVE